MPPWILDGSSKRALLSDLQCTKLLKGVCSLLTLLLSTANLASVLQVWFLALAENSPCTASSLSRVFKVVHLVSGTGFTLGALLSDLQCTKLLKGVCSLLTLLFSTANLALQVWFLSLAENSPFTGSLLCSVFNFGRLVSRTGFILRSLYKITLTSASLAGSSLHTRLVLNGTLPLLFVVT